MFSKPTKEELAKRPLGRKGRKEGAALIKGVKKFLRYNDDLISDTQKEVIDEKKSAFVESMKNPEAKRGELEELAKDLTDTCKSSVKSYSASAWKENIEVIFVAVVIAMGIRAYFIQQFKIPTGSMQPTLNGIVAYPTKEINPRAERNAPDGYEPPALPKKLWDKFWYGRSHVDWVAEEDDIILLDKENFYGKTHFLFFPRTYLKTQKGHVYSAPGTHSRIATLLSTEVSPNPSYVRVAKVKKGQTIAKGFVDTGDQLVVNKFVYHWKKPERSDVFVFNTRNIGMIQRGLDDPRQGSQHYIKRLAGTPGDAIEIRPPELYINGELAEDEGFQNVMSQEGYYTGYRGNGTTKVELPERRYWALGDNSANSLDSRNWGTVPEQNIVGRAAFVYYPFGHHFGPIK